MRWLIVSGRGQMERGVLCYPGSAAGMMRLRRRRADTAAIWRYRLDGALQCGLALGTVSASIELPRCARSGDSLRVV